MLPEAGAAALPPHGAPRGPGVHGLAHVRRPGRSAGAPGPPTALGGSGGGAHGLARALLAEVLGQARELYGSWKMKESQGSWRGSALILSDSRSGRARLEMRREHRETARSFQSWHQAVLCGKSELELSATTADRTLSELSGLSLGSPIVPESEVKSPEPISEVWEERAMTWG